MSWMKYWGMVLLMLLSVFVWADPSIGDASNNLYEPVSVLTMAMSWACYVIGAALCIGAIAQFRIHLQSPKLTPLMTPIVMVICGVILILLPYFSLLPGDSWSAYEQSTPNVPYSAGTTEREGDGHWTDRPQYQQKR